MTDNLDQRLVGRQFVLSLTDIQVGASFYGIFYRLRAEQPLHVGETVRVVAADQYGLTVQVMSSQ